MITGGKLTTKEGVQVACFPSQQIYITQGANSPYSHYGTKNTDNSCQVGLKQIYAPVDMKVVSNQSSGGFGIVIYHSLEKVLLADGSIDYLTLVCMHDNNAVQWQVGNIYRQGDYMYHEGNADPNGWTTGIHVHYEVAKGLHTDRVISVSGGRYHIVNESYIDEIFFKNLTEVVRENALGEDKGDHTFVFREYDGEIGPPTPKPQGDGIYHAMLSRAFPNIL